MSKLCFWCLFCKLLFGTGRERERGVECESRWKKERGSVTPSFLTSFCPLQSGVDTTDTTSRHTESLFLRRRKNTKKFSVDTWNIELKGYCTVNVQCCKKKGQLLNVLISFQNNFLEIYDKNLKHRQFKLLFNVVNNFLQQVTWRVVWSSLEIITSSQTFEKVA